MQNAKVWRRQLNVVPQPASAANEPLKFLALPGEGLVVDSAVLNDDRVTMGEIFFEMPAGEWDAGTYGLVIDLPDARASLPITLRLERAMRSEFGVRAGGAIKSLVAVTRTAAPDTCPSQTTDLSTLAASHDIINLGMLADAVRRERHGDRTTFVRVADVASEVGAPMVVARRRPAKYASSAFRRRCGRAGARREVMLQARACPSPPFRWPISNSWRRASR